MYDTNDPHGESPHTVPAQGRAYGAILFGVMMLAAAWGIAPGPGHDAVVWIGTVVLAVCGFVVVAIGVRLAGRT